MRDNSKADELAQIILGVINEKKPQSVKQLIAILTKDTDLDEEEIFESVLRLQTEGKMKFGDKTLKSMSPTSYVRTDGAIWYWVILVAEVIIATMIFTISEAFYPWIYIRNVFGVVFVLFLPGYAFTKTLFPVNIPNKTSTEDFEKIGRLALSVGVSLAIVSLIGLLLYYSPWGLELTAIVLVLVAFTSVFATTAVIREYKAKKANWKEPIPR